MARPKADKPSIFLIVTPRGFEPATQWDAEIHGRYKIGRRVEASLSDPRSMQQERLLWRILGIVVGNQDVYPTAQALMTALKIALAHVDSVMLIGGGVHVEPRSLTDFDSDEFNRFFDEALRVIATEVIPGLDIDALVKEGRIAVDRRAG